MADRKYEYEVAIDLVSARQAAAELKAIFSRELQSIGPMGGSGTGGGITGAVVAETKAAGSAVKAAASEMAQGAVAATSMADKVAVASTATKALGGATTTAASQLDKMTARLAATAGQAGGLGSAFNVMGAESLAGMGGAVLLGGAILGVGAAAVAGAVSLGSMALKADAVALYGKNATTSVDALAASSHQLSIVIGRMFAPAVNDTAGALTQLTYAMAGEGGSLDAVAAKLAYMESKQRAGAEATSLLARIMVGEGVPGTDAYAASIERLRLQLEGVESVRRTGLTLPDTQAGQQGALDRQKLGAELAAYYPPTTQAELDAAHGVYNTNQQAQVELVLGKLDRGIEQNQAADRGIWQAEQSAITRDEAAWKQAVGEMESAFKSAMQKGSDYMKGLQPGTTGADKLAPGQNGPFEALYRLADVAKQGDKSPWAAGLGKTQAQAADITGKFGAGMWMDPSVLPFIDKAKLGEYYQQQQAGAAQQQQFAAMMAGQYGVNMPAATGSYAGGPGGTTAAGAGVGAGMTGMDLSTPAVAGMNALLTDKEFIKASNAVGKFAAQQFGAAWGDEIGATGWGKMMADAIELDVLRWLADKLPKGP